MGYSTIFVVGNGFDLNLKLKTSYNEFINSELVKEYSNKHQNGLIKFLYEKNKLSWIDIERELKEYSEYLMTDRPFGTDTAETQFDRQKKEFRKDYNELCDILKKYLKEVTKEIPSEHTKSAAYKVLEEKVCKKGTYCILNFNYTDTIKKIINCDFNDGSRTHQNSHIQYVHGNLEEDIVFGIEDKASVDTSHVFLYKSHNQKQDISSLRRYLDESLNIIFFGYSLGETDHSYFDEFFKHYSTHGCHYKHITFYYKDDDAYDNLVVQLNTLTDSSLSKLKQYNSVKFIKVSEIE